MHSRTTGRLTAAVATAAGLAVLVPAAANALPAAHPTAAISQDTAKPAAKLTIAGYKAYLKKNWKNGGHETFTAFSKLTPAQQAKFLRYLENRRIYQALQDQVKGSLGRTLHTTDPYNKDVTFVTDVTSRTAKDKAGTTTLRFAVSERIYKIPVTTETLTLRFASQGSGKSKKTVAIAEVENINTAIKITAGPAHAASKGAVSRATVTWIAKPQVTAFGARKVTKDQAVSAAVAKATRSYTASLRNA